MKQGLNIDELKHTVFGMNKHDVIVPANNLEVNLFHGVSAMKNISGTQFLPITDHAFGQVASDLGIPRSFVKNLNETDNFELLQHNTNTLLKQSSKSRLLRINNEQGIRGYLSNSFSTTYDNDMILKSVMPVLEDMGDDIEIESCSLTDTKMYLKVTSKRLQGDVKVGDPVCGGISIVNSEVGMSFYSENEFIKRLVCDNGMVRSNNISSFRKMHRGERKGLGVVAPDTTRAIQEAIALQIRDSIKRALDPERFQQSLLMMKEIAGRKIAGKVPKVIEELGRTVGFTKDDGEEILKHFVEGGDLSQWGLLNATTRYSQDVTSYDKATNLELIGGKILELTPRQWTNISEAA